MGVHAYGRNHVLEPAESLPLLHFYKGAPLHEVDHEPKIGVLDQEDLTAQGIDTSVLVPGAPKVDALGSCTANANTAALSNVMAMAAFLATTGCTSYTDVIRAEEFSILFYNADTMQTGNPTTEWPPTDCGSSGIYVVEENVKRGYCSSQQIATNAQSIVSLLQTDGILIGQPFLNAWEEPDANGFVDGDGSVTTIESQIALGVAGGHETYGSGIVKLTLTETGLVVPEQTILKVRNSWDKSWGDNGNYLIHLSSYVALMNQCDFRQLVV